MKLFTFFKSTVASLALVTALAPAAQAQRVGTPGGFIQFNTNASGGLLGHEQVNGTFGTFGAASQWIGLGQPIIGPGGQLLDGYGMRIQWSEQLATFNLADFNTQGQDPKLEVQWGPKVEAANFNYVFDPLIGAAGKTTVVSMTSKELVGIRSTSPFRTLQVRHQSSVNNGGGISLQNESTNREWTIFTGGTGLELYYQGAFRGRFSSVDGVYLPISDKRLKKDIAVMEPVMEKVMKLKPSTYHFNEQSENDPRCFGLIAQELKEVFPEVVDVRTDNNNPNVLENLHTVSYTELIPVLIKGMQEQQEMISEMNDLVSSQKEEIETLKAQLKGAGNAAEKTSAFESAQNFETSVLFQNNPNPFSNFTNIEYQLAPGFRSAVIYVFDMSGRQVKAIDGLVEGKGKVTISANELEAGMFIYSLVVDGKEVSTKRMILTK